MSKTWPIAEERGKMFSRWICSECYNFSLGQCISYYAENTGLESFSEKCIGNNEILIMPLLFNPARKK